MSASSVMLNVAGNGLTPGPPPVAVSWNVNDPAFSDVLQSLKTPVGSAGSVVSDGRFFGASRFDCWVSPQAITTAAMAVTKHAAATRLYTRDIQIPPTSF